MKRSQESWQFLLIKTRQGSNKMNVPVIETSRLRLRGWKNSDAAALAELNANPEFVRFFGNGEPIDKFESWKVLAMLAGHWMLKGFGFWLVEDKFSNEFVGRVGIWEPEGWPGVETGWGISPKHWGKGYAPEAAIAAMTWGFENLEIDALISVIHPDNHASKMVAYKIGETFSHSQQVNGKLCDIYRITKEEFSEDQA